MKNHSKKHYYFESNKHTEDDKPATTRNREN